MQKQNLDKSNISPEMVESLEKAFLDFQERAEKLSSAYADMQADFKKLNLELDRKNRELADSLARQEETQTYLSSILESMNSGVIGIDVAGTVTQFNRAAADITGQGPDTVLGRSYTEVFSREAREHGRLLDVLRTGGGHVWDEKVIWHREGYPVPVSYQTATLRDQSGRTLGAVEIFNDISKIKALEEEMQRTKTMAALGEMSATVAHEIRNPLGAMGVWAGLLDRDFDRDDPRRKTLKRIIDGLARLNRIVSNLLVYSRPLEARLRRVALQDILTETVDFVEIEIERLGQHVTVTRAFAGEDSVTVMADPEKMQQVIMNLCMNALQAMPDGGDLRVSVEDSPKGSAGYACFEVTDTGEGIEEERLEKIFDPFHTTKENGTGLGLAIVKKFVEHHSGYIRVRSTKGRGTSVRVFLPRREERGEGA
ncbi:MAG: PAS domain S-box protein [Chitinivibrionales bacterium]|nr:PAS domain S-box protein [Chitinivibrionales bacterium]MBD3394471.1 PAS domain S-box protein [Chitinivibrionales bacterium]